MNCTEPTPATQAPVNEHSLQLRTMLSAITHDLSSRIRKMIGFADLMSSSTQQIANLPGLGMGLTVKCHLPHTMIGA
jgi:hypothetical protein